MEIIKIPLSDLTPDPNNAKDHPDWQIEQIKNSIEQFGNLDPIGVWGDDNLIVEGHGRYEALKELGFYEAECIRLDWLTEEERRAYALAHNKLTMNSDFIPDALDLNLDAISEIDMSLFGFNVDVGGDPQTEIEEDDFSEDVEPRCKLGDVWQLGDHRLICGDSTDIDVVGKLMDGETADCVFTDPPYNVAIGSKNAFLNTVQPSGRCTEDIANDKGMTDEEIGKTLWLPAFQRMRENAKDSCSIYVTMPQGGTHMMMMMIAEAGWQVKHELMWRKNSPTFSMGRLDYDYQHEPILYGWNKTHKFYGKGSQNKSVWEYDKPRKCDLHPTMKPVELVANALLNSTTKGETVMDLFGGSGTTLIACEQLERRCNMCELDPHYCDVIIERWEKLTGREAVLLDDES